MPCHLVYTEWRIHPSQVDHGWMHALHVPCSLIITTQCTHVSCIITQHYTVVMTHETGDRDTVVYWWGIRWPSAPTEGRVPTPEPSQAFILEVHSIDGPEVGLSRPWASPSHFPIPRRVHVCMRARHVTSPPQTAEGLIDPAIQEGGHTAGGLALAPRHHSQCQDQYRTLSNLAGVEWNSERIRQRCRRWVSNQTTTKVNGCFPSLPFPYSLKRNNCLWDAGRA